MFADDFLLYERVYVRAWNVFGTIIVCIEDEEKREYGVICEWPIPGHYWQGAAYQLQRAVVA